MNRKMVLLGVAVLIVLIGWWAMGSKNPDSDQNQPASQNQQNNSNPNNNPQAADADNVVSGVLRVSNLSSRGNLMVVTDTQVIYLRTSRDFSALIGKEVNVSFEGDLDNFKLIDIQAK